MTKSTTSTPVAAPSLTKLGPQQYSLVGSQGVALTIYTLRKLGVPAMEAGEGLPFDVLALGAGQLIRIQVKSTQGADAQNRFSFLTARGRYAVKTLHAVPLTTYSEKEVDLLACAALPLERVVFIPVTNVTGSKLTIPEAEFLKSNASASSFEDCLSSLAKCP